MVPGLIACVLAIASGFCLASEIPRGRLPDGVEPLHYALELRVVPEWQRFSGVVRIKANIAAPVERIWLHGLNLEVDRAHIEDAGGHRVPARYVQRTDTGVAELTSNSQLEAGVVTIELSFSAPFSHRMKGLFKVVERGRSYAFTQFAQIDARRAFPCFDEPRFKTPFDISIVTRRDHVAIGNAPLRREIPIDARLKRIELMTTDRLPTSLLALAIGDLDVVNAAPISTNRIRTRDVPLRAVAAHGKGSQLTYALNNTAATVTALEQYFGLPYPYRKLDLIAVPMWGGAMENAAAITYAEKYLLIKEDASAAQRQSFANVHAHELAHQWFGNLVTPAWWDDLWLNESFASWLANRIVAGADGNSLAARESLRDGLSAMNEDSRSRAQPLRQPIHSTDDFAGGFSPLIYGKGAAVLTMLEGFAGEAAFRDGIRLYMRRFHDGVATGAGFLEALAHGSKLPALAPALVSFLDQPGVPLLTMSWQCESGRLEVDLAQSRYLPVAARAEAQRSWTVPVCVSLDDGSQHCMMLEQPRQSWTIALAQCPATLMPNANGAGYYRFSLPQQRMIDLARRLDRLDAREALSLMDSLSAELSAGRLAVDDYLVAVEHSALHPSADVVVAPLPVLKLISRHLVTQRPVLRRRLIDLYAPRIRAVDFSGDSVPGDDDETSLLRAALLPFLALELRDESVRGPLGQLGRRYLSAAGTRPAVSDTLSTALAVAVQEGGQPALDRLWAMLEGSTDMLFRSSVLSALAQVTDPPQALWVRNRLLSPHLGENEVVDLFLEHAGVDDNLPGAWTWLQAHLEELAARAPVYRQNQLIAVVKGFCTERQRREVEAALSKVAARIEDGPSAAQEALEDIDTCAALATR
jgi:cytosol alanyl aminopeptidase